MMHLIILEFLVASPLVRNVTKSRISSSVSIIRSVELGTKQLNNVGQSLQEDLFNPSIKLGNPVFQIGIALEI